MVWDGPSTGTLSFPSVSFVVVVGGGGGVAADDDKRRSSVNKK